MDKEGDSLRLVISAIGVPTYNLKKLVFLLASRLGQSVKHEKLQGFRPQTSDWNSKLITARVSLLCHYAYRTTCFIYGPGFPTTASYKHDAKLDVLDIVFSRPSSCGCI
jgi:hypothetical protein